ncbi:hypothetical protein GUJ93_ZPchr0012g20203 [Zizania palustris]|uniref:Uncharacterized protein n=1 Tax=Zizania palustris TaxID=103762 RepID=A0A8J5WTE5_ZIZPA|nr:hypothetical protein GUJ93_ZPchr0012g20203 [Zizania palustris]
MCSVQDNANQRPDLMEHNDFWLLKKSFTGSRNKRLKLCSKDYSEGLSGTLTTILAVIPSCSYPEDLNFGKSHSLFYHEVWVSKCSFSC